MVFKLLLVRMERNYFEQFICKKVKIIFDDGSQITRKEGVLTGYNESFIFLSVNDKSEAIAIPKIVRIEFLEEEE